MEALSKLVAAGFEQGCVPDFQEYFEKLNARARTLGQADGRPAGRLMAQVDLGIASIGGKDSMSGTFEQLDVPPTLISFATAMGNMKRATSLSSREPDTCVIRIAPRYQADGLAGQGFAAGGVLRG